MSDDRIKEAAARIAPYIRPTPTFELSPGLHLKLECLQVTGSFKPRGMFNRMLTGSVPRGGVVAASGGNAGLAIAHAAQRLGHRAEIFVPVGAPAVKVAAIEAYGGAVHQVGDSFADALEASVAHAQSADALFMHAYDQPEVVLGAGTIGMELPAVDTILVAVGGGGLIAGLAAWFAGSVRVVGVEPAGCPTMAAAVKAGEPVDIDPSGVGADSLGARRIGDLAWEQIQRGHISDTLIVPEEALLEARHTLWSTAHIAAEPGAAAAFAAISSGVYVPARDERVAIIVCGANASPTDL